jgi:hypothetical protein
MTTACEVVAAARQVYDDPSAVVVFDATARGAVILYVDEGRYVMATAFFKEKHSIAAEKSITSLDRLVAHFAGFVGVDIREAVSAINKEGV